MLDVKKSYVALETELVNVYAKDIVSLRALIDSKVVTTESICFAESGLYSVQAV